MRRWAGRPGWTFPDALGYAGPAIAPAYRVPREWLVWGDVRGAGWNTSAALGGLGGGQINALIGVTRKVAPDFLVGVVGGYENFSYTSQEFNGRLTGDGLTLGAYTGWRILPTLRFNAALTYSDIGYDGSAGLASGTFNGQRWLATTGLTGSYKLAGLELQPSANIFALWERESAYVDSLGTVQDGRSFVSGRASTGAKLIDPLTLPGSARIAPYAGLYADYYLFNDNEAVAQQAPLAPLAYVQGWSARVTSGVSVSLPSGVHAELGGEVGGLGSGGYTTWSARGSIVVPF